MFLGQPQGCPNFFYTYIILFFSSRFPKEIKTNTKTGGFIYLVYRVYKRFMFSKEREEKS